MYNYESSNQSDYEKKFTIKHNNKDLLFVTTEREAKLYTNYLNTGITDDLNQDEIKFINNYKNKEVEILVEVIADNGEHIDNYIEELADRFESIINNPKLNKRKFKVVGKFNDFNFEITKLTNYIDLREVYKLMINNNNFRYVETYFGKIYRQ